MILNDSKNLHNLADINKTKTKIKPWVRLVLVRDTASIHCSSKCQNERGAAETWRIICPPQHNCPAPCVTQSNFIQFPLFPSFNFFLVFFQVKFPSYEAVSIYKRDIGYRLLTIDRRPKIFLNC